MDAEDVLDLIQWEIKDLADAEEIKKTVKKIEDCLKEKKVEQLRTELFLFK